MQVNYYKKQYHTNNGSASSVFTKRHWVKKLPSFLMVSIINLYQYTLSPDHGIISYFTAGQCKFRPTCSEYTKQIIQEQGVIKGLQKGWRQLIRCR